MTARLFFAALALGVLPGLAGAQCGSHQVKEITASTCGEGMIWDAGRGTCVDAPTG